MRLRPTLKRYYRSRSRALALCGALFLGLACSGKVAAQGCTRAVLAVAGSEVLAEEAKGELLVPGSVQKLVVATASLHFLGPHFRARTQIRASGSVDQGTLAGDLWVLPAADPTWNRNFFPEDPRQPLRALARDLRASGLRRVQGDLVIDLRPFPGRSFPSNRPLGDLAFALGAPTSALAVDENTARVRIAPGARVGAPGLISSSTPGFEASGSLVTVGRERHGRGTVDFLPLWERPGVQLRGEYPISEPPYDVEVAVLAPEIHAAQQLQAALEEYGLEIEGSLRWVRGTLQDKTAQGDPPRTLLAELRSPTLAEILPMILSESHNWYAAMLLRQLAAQVQGSGRSDDGLELLQRFLEEQVGLDTESFVLDDASGLSQHNRLSATAIVQLLRWSWRQPWRESLVHALATNGRGTLEAWPKLPLVAAKTGTVRGALGLAGFLFRNETGDLDRALQQGDEEPVIFAFLFRAQGPDRPALRREAARLLDAWQAQSQGLLSRSARD